MYTVSIYLTTVLHCISPGISDSTDTKVNEAGPLSIRWYEYPWYLLIINTVCLMKLYTCIHTYNYIYH